MSDTTPITEMTEFDAERVDLVPAGANGFPFLVMKSLDDEVASKEEIEPVEKAEDDEVAEGEAAIPDVVASDVEYVESDVTDSAGNEPGDPAWEAADAANLTAAAESLVEVAQRIAAASDREAAEGEWRSSFRLDDALCAVEAALGIVAALSYVEAQGEDGVAAKAAALSPIAADILGRARTTLAELFGESASQEDIVTKSEIEALVDERVAQFEHALSGIAPAEKAADETEAVEAEVAEKAADEIVADEPEAEVAEKAADEPEAVEPEVAEKAADETPADEPEVAVKAADEPVVSTPEETPVAEVLKSVVADAIKEALAPALKGLEDRIDAVESQPAPGGPFLNGSPFAQQLRSTPAGDEPTDVSKALDAIADPSLRAQVARDIAISQATKVYGG